MLTDEATSTPSAHEYLRVSTDKSGREKSQDDQGTDNARVRTEHGWRHGRVYRDTGSASRYAKKARGDFAKLMADLKAGEIPRGDVLQLWESSRGSRRQAEWALLLDELHDHGVLVAVTSHGRTYDLSNPRDRRSLDEDGVDSAYESGKISGRTRRGLANNALAGLPHGQVKDGYVRIYNERTGAFVRQERDPKRAPIIREIIRRVAASEALNTIRRDLEAQGILTATGNKHWNSKVITDYATNPVYLGKRLWQGDLIEAVWPPISDDDQLETDFWAAVKRVNEGKGIRPSKSRWLLSSLALCDVCEQPLGRRGGSNSHTVMSYGCVNGCVAIRLERLEEVVTTAIVKRLADPDLVELFQHQTDDEEIVKARSEAARLRADLEQWRQLAEAGEVVPLSFARAEQGLLSKIEAAEEKSKQVRVPPVLRDLIDPEGRIEVVTARWKLLTLAAKRDVIRTLMTIRLKKGKRGPIFDPERIAIEWVQ